MITAATVLSGCSPNAGSAAGEDFTTFISGEAGVADVRISATNNLPFAGSVTATVTVHDDVSEERVGELANLIGAYIDEHDSARTDWSSVQLDVGGFTLSLGAVQADNDQVRGLYSELQETANVVGGMLAWHTVSVDVPSLHDLVAAYDATEALLDGFPLFEAALLSSAHETAGFTLSGGDERIRPDAAIDAFTAAATAFDLSGARLTPDAFDLTVRQQADVTPATDFIAALPCAERLGAVTIVSGPVTSRGEYDF